MGAHRNQQEDDGRLRIFVAVKLPAGVRDRLVRAQQSLRVGSRAVKWVSHEAMHLTLAFAGEVSVDQAQAIAGSLEPAVRGLGCFHLEIAGLGCFGPPQRPRVLWAGVPRPPPALAFCRERADEALLAAGIKPEQRPFHPHITLGRIRRGARAPDLTLALSAARTTLYGNTNVHAVCVMQSRLTPAGARHEIYHRCPLEGEG